ncbi:MAG TPA: FlgD immunoglobulin-like domain containing protein [Candidatus Eisenbacteria bacterium]|jgi:DNA-binding beta-propeller fold protein YncE
MPVPLRFAAALAALLTVSSLFATQARAARAYVVESDFSTGSFSSVDVATKARSCDVASVFSDARVRWYDGRVYVVNRFGADNIEVLDGTSFALVRQFSVGNGANPYDIAFASPTHAYVTRYESTDLWIVDPTTGAHTGTVSLAGLADADGIPEMDRLEKVGPLLFVSLQRVNRNAGFAPTDSSLVAVIDTRTDALVDCDAVAPGVQGILLPRPNPVTPFVFDTPRTRLYLGCVGSYGVPDGGIVSVDPVALRADGVVASEDSLGGDVLDLAWHDDQRAYAIVSDPAFNTTLIRWSPASGRREVTLYSPGGFSLADAEVTPDGEEVWACNSSFGSPGIRVFATATGLPVGPAITCTLPPQGISFDDATSQVAGVNDGIARSSFAPPFPNPARGPVRLAFSLGGGEARVEILDVAGRRVRTWTRLATAPGALELTWDLRDDAGRSVPPGVYLADLRSGERVLSRRVLVLR